MPLQWDCVSGILYAMAGQGEEDERRAVRFTQMPSKYAVTALSQ